MLVLRLQRTGKKHQPGFRLVVAEGRSKLVGPPTEDLGPYDISKKKAAFKRDRVLHWLGVGAQATATVHNLLLREGIITGAKRKVSIRAAKVSEASGTAAPAEAQAPAAAVAPPEAQAAGS